MFSLARVIGSRGHRQWLLYAHSPVQPRKSVRIEIPEFGGAGYDASYRDRPFTIHDLAGTLTNLTEDCTKFDLILLSTCFGGTPYTIGLIGPFARYIIASPENLHLSYFDLQPLEHLEIGLGDGDVHALAERFAQRSSV